MKATATRTIGAKGKGHIYIPEGEQLSVGPVMCPSADNRRPTGSLEESKRFVLITGGKYAGTMVAREAVRFNGSNSTGQV